MAGPTGWSAAGPTGAGSRATPGRAGRPAALSTAADMAAADGVAVARRAEAPGDDEREKCLAGFVPTAAGTVMLAGSVAAGASEDSPTCGNEPPASAGWAAASTGDEGAGE